MVDKVKPLKLEDSISGTETNMFPVELDPTEDYVAAKGIAFENSDSTFISGKSGLLCFQDSDVPEVNLLHLVSSASPGFVFGAGGNTGAGDLWLQNNGVASNQVGIPVLINNPTLTALAIRNSDATASFTIEVYEHDGTTFTLVHTESITTSRGDDFILVTPATLTYGKELAVKKTSGSAKDLKVICLLGGNAI